MKILITGAGLIGCHAAAHLIECGHEVVLFDVSPSMDYISNVLRSREVAVRTGDILEIGRLADLQPDNQENTIDMVVHTAGVIGGNARANPYAAMRTNLIGTIELAEAARKAGIKRIVYASTHGVYDLEKVRESPFLETAPVTAESVYGAAKLSSEHVLQTFGKTYGIEIVVLRFTNIFGYGEFVGGSSGGSAFQQLLTAALQNSPVPIPQSLNGYGEWLYVKDAAMAVRDALERPLTQSFTIANIGSGVLNNEHDIAATVKSFLPGAEFQSSGNEGTHTRSTERYQPFDPRTAESEIGFSPKFTLRDGVRDYIDELKRVIP